LNASRIKQRAREISDALIQNNQYYSGAIKHISASIDAGLRIVFSTTNYCEAAEAFLNRLVAQGLLKERDRDKIICSGSIFDWERRSIAHFNMGKGKIAGLSKTLRIPVDELSNYTDSVYGDDPQGNDSGILSLSDRAFVIANPQNSEIPLPANMIRTSWKDILKNYF